MHNNNNFKIEERRRKVASMLAQSMTETEIAEQLDVDQSTISRDVKALKEMSQQFVFDLARSDLAYYSKPASIFIRTPQALKPVAALESQAKK
jgi:IS30 family transposase